MLQQLQQIAAAPGLAQRAEAKTREDLPHIMGNIEQVLRQGARVAVERFGICGQTRRTFDVAVLRHDALEHHERGGSELEAVAAKQR